MVFCGAASLALAAQAKPGWQVEWEKTLEAAKKEGQLSIYISGYEEILPEFQKEYPEIKVVPTTGRGSQVGQRLIAERRAEKISCRCGERGWRNDVSAAISRQSFRSDQAGAVVAGDQRYIQMVSEQASLRRSGKSVHLRVRRHRDLWLDQLQHQID
jgi:hypothetical protein